MTQSPSNPLASSRLRPGEIEYLPPGDASLAGIVKRLQQNRWRGEIIGPHGSGKSTLVQSLLPRLAARGCQITLGAFQGGQQRWSSFPAADETAGEDASHHRVYVIDGFEQLSPPVRVWWKLSTSARGRGLIVTAHAPVGLPHLCRTDVTPSLAVQIVQQLAGDAASRFPRDKIEGLLESHQGNMRDTLFALYDEYEAQRRAETDPR